MKSGLNEFNVMNEEWKVEPKDGDGNELRLLSEALEDMFCFKYDLKDGRRELFLNKGRDALLYILSKSTKTVEEVKQELKKTLIVRYNEYNSRSIRDSFWDTLARFKAFSGKGGYNPWEVSYFMIASKEARSYGTPFKYDTFLDIIGYSVIGMCLLEEENEN